MASRGYGRPPRLSRHGRRVDEVSRGRAEIRRELTKVLRALGSGSKHTSVISGVEFVTGDVAVVDGEAFVQDALAEGSAGSLHHRFTDVLVRRNHEWLIPHIRAYEVFSPTGLDSVQGAKA